MALSHSQRVTRLYRASLKHLESWTIEREVFSEEALQLQQLFRKNAGVKDEALARTLLEKGEAQLKDLFHPDLYKMPTAVGGSKYMRNPPPLAQVVRDHS